MRLVDEAIAISGQVPLLLAMKGRSHWNRVNIPMGEPVEGALDSAEELAERALALEPDCHLAIFVRGLVAGSRGRPEAGLVDLHRAQTLHPGDANVALELAGTRSRPGSTARSRSIDSWPSIR